MPYLITALASFLGPFVTKLILGLGIATVSYEAAHVTLGYAQSYILGSFGAQSGSVLEMINAIGLITGTNMLFAAYAARFATQSVGLVLQRAST